MTRIKPYMTVALLLAALGPAAAQSPPPGVASLVNTLQAASTRHDVAALSKITQGNPRTVYAWNFRPADGGFGIAPRTWKYGALQPPGRQEWLAVVWDYLPCESQGDHVYRLVKTGQGYKVAGEIPETDPLGFRLRDHDITVRLDPPKHLAYFTDHVKVEQLDASASLIQMRINADFPVDSVRLAGKSLPFSQLGGVIYITAPHQAQFVLDMAYHGKAYNVGMFVGNYLTDKEMVLSAYWYPTIARLPTTHSVTAIVPRTWIAIGQGDLVSQSTGASTATFTYRMPVPNCFFTLDAGPYFKYSKQVNGRTYSVYMLHDDPVRGNKQVALMDPSFRLFESLWGPYPFNHYAIVVTSQPGWPGALEAYTFTTYGETMPLPNPNPHEWGHTWWGGFVPCTYLQDIWNESFASYSESVFARHGDDQPASPEVRDRMLWTHASAGLDQAVNQVPMSQSADALYGLSAAAGYVKGTLVMQNLEEVLGFDLMQRCMHAFRDEFYDSERAAAWPDFERVVDKVTGQDYTWWFDQWVRRPGLPQIRLEKVTSQPSGGQYQVEGDIVQSTPTYRLKVPVELFTASGDPVKSTVEITGERTHFTLTADAAPVKLNIDPEIRLPRVVDLQEAQSMQVTFQNCLLITGSGSSAAADALRNFGVAAKRDTAATPAVIKGKDLILVGSAATNALWKRYAAACPFTVDAGSIAWNGKSYPGDGAIAVTANPDDPNHRIVWVANTGTEGLVSQVAAGPRMIILDAEGHLVDGEPAVVGAGPTVHRF